VACLKGREDFWPVTGWMGQEVECMEENQDKLNHLHLGQIFFPPQNLMSSQGSKCVVRVHDGMNECVDKRNESSTMIGRELESDPSCKWHNGVVEDMESRNISKLFSQHKKDSVSKVEKFGDVIDIAKEHK